MLIQYLNTRNFGHVKEKGIKIDLSVFVDFMQIVQQL